MCIIYLSLSSQRASPSVNKTKQNKKAELADKRQLDKSRSQSYKRRKPNQTLLQLFVNFKSEKTISDSMKNHQLAENFSLKAVACVSANLYTEALENFNQCLRYAPNKSQVLSDAFAGRAEVYFQVQHFQRCSDNIQLAIDTSLSEEKCKTLKAFQEKCREKLMSISSDNSTRNLISLTKPAHKKIPFIADCLEVRENEIYGRFIMTTRDLSPGDVVVLEEPFYKILGPKQHNTRCAVCLQQNVLNLFPCAKCSDGESVDHFVIDRIINTKIFIRFTIFYCLRFFFSLLALYFLLFLAMFCSRVCSDSVIHRYECNAPKEEAFDKLLLQRMFYQAVQITGSLEELQKLMNRQTTSKTIMDFDLSDPTDPMKDKNRILATTSLAEREPWSAEAYAKYESVTQQLQTETEDERNFLRNYLVRCLKSMTVNFFHFFWSPNQAEGQGFALCSLAAYFAHSCDPNVEKIDVDNKFAFVVKKPIKGGEQLFMNYDRYSFLTHSLKERQDYFTKIYTFQCACSACKDDYPALPNLKKFDDKFVLPDVKEKTGKAAHEQYKKNCEYIKTNIERYPCFEICSLMVQNYDLLHAIGNDLSF